MIVEIAEYVNLSDHPDAGEKWKKKKKVDVFSEIFAELKRVISMKFLAYKSESGDEGLLWENNDKDFEQFELLRKIINQDLSDAEFKEHILLNIVPQLKESPLFATLSDELFDQIISALTHLDTSDAKTPQQRRIARWLMIFKDVSEEIVQQFSQDFQLPKYHSVLSASLSKYFLEAAAKDDFGNELLAHLLDVMKTHHSIYGYSIGKIDEEEMRKRVGDETKRWLMISSTEADLRAGSGDPVTQEDIERVRNYV